MRLWPSQRSKNNATSLQRSVTHDVLRVYAGVACRAGVSGGTQCGPMRFLLSQHERPAGGQAIIRHTVHSSGRGVSACKEKASCLQGGRIILKILPFL